jgi:ribonuclease HII
VRELFYAMTRSLDSHKIRDLTVADLMVRVTSAVSPDPRLLRALARDSRHGVRRLAARLRAHQLRKEREAARLDGLFAVEREQLAEGFEAIAGVDEVGVAPLAGPVLAAAVGLAAGAFLPGLNDSKQLTPEQRNVLYDQITQSAIAIQIGVATVEEIDRLNILQATRLAHRRAILGLPIRPKLVLIDGRYPADVPIPQLVIVDGDATCACIAAASVIAKVTRDRRMADLGRQYPAYGFERHKGYGTREHVEAIRRYGMTPLHRQSFVPLQGSQEPLSIG